MASLEDFESRLNAAIERNAFLESELDDKESLKIAVQRMKDETRDLKSELRVLAPRHPNLSSLDSTVSVDLPDNDKRASSIGSSSERNNNSMADSNKLAADCETKSECEENGILDTPPNSSQSSPATTNGIPQSGSATPTSPATTPLTPSARISALNIVGDLLRKVGALELKLVSCRNIVKENGSSAGGSASVTPVTTPVGHAATSSNSSPTTPASASAAAVQEAMTNGSGTYSFVGDRSRRYGSRPVIKKVIDSS